MRPPQQAPVGRPSDTTPTGFYVYRNSGKHLQRHLHGAEDQRNNPVATVVVSGSGLISLASLGSNVIYLTVLRQAENLLVRVNKTGGTPTETATPPPLSSVQTSSSGVHQLSESDQRRQRGDGLHPPSSSMRTAARRC